MVGIEVQLELDEIELPASPGAILKVRVTSGAQEFFGPAGFRIEGAFTIKVNDEMWRAALEGIKKMPDGEILATFRIESRYQ